jgi:sortase A
VIETRDAWYAYQVTRFEDHVRPTDVGVKLPVPRKPGAKPTKKMITLTTCSPRWSSTERYIVWGELTGELPKTPGNTQMPPALQV